MNSMIVMYILAVLVFAGIFILFSLPWQPFIYGWCILSLLFGLYLLWQIYRGIKRHGELQRLNNCIDAGASELPAAKGLIEKDYQQLIRVLYQEKCRQASQADLRYGDMLDYYTLWAHQIKTPIAAMDLLLQTEALENGREVQGELFKIRQYVEMVLIYLRLGEGTSDFVFREYQVDEIIRKAIRRFAPQFIRKKIRLEYAGAAKTVVTDEKWLLFILGQILSNAVKYTPEGTVTIRFSEDYVITIADTGIGISPEDLPRIFEKGFTGYNGHEDKKSTGIGLYLCRRIADKLSCRLQAESVPGQGTVISIALPMHGAEVE